jgi:hypothetical protein
MRKGILTVLIVFTVSFIAFAGYLLYYIIDTSDDFSEKVVIRNEGEIIKTIEVSNLSLVPSESKVYEIELVSIHEGKFFVTLDYEELENGGLSEFVSVIIKLDDGNEYYRGYLKDLFDDEILLNMCFEANVSQKITITYLMPIEVGNEAMHTYSDFNINITIKRNAGE